jgi:hypothetical protein
MLFGLSSHLIVRFSCVCELFDVSVDVLEQKCGLIGLPVF